MKLKTRVTLSYPTHKVFVKVSKRSVVDMAFKTTSKVAEPSKTSWSPQGQRPYGQPKWCHLLVPMWWPRLWWGIHRRNLQDLWWKIQRGPEGPLIYSSSQQSVHAFQYPFRPEEDYRSSWKLVYIFNQMFCYRDYQLTTSIKQVYFSI